MYKVRWVKRLSDGDDKDMHGYTDNDDKVIKINTSYTEQSVKDTLLHEIQHAIFHDTYAFDVGDNGDPEVLEERVIRIFTPRLLQVMLDNPDLVDYLFKRDENEKI
jgi:hypothetical protein